MAEGHRMDLTAKLPDEMLKEIFHHLPLRYKLRVESVSHRFQRCLLDLLNTKPMPLVFDSERMNLNGYGVSQEQLPGVVQTLASKAKFSRIELNHAPKKRLNSILAALVSSVNDCLDKVTSVQVLSRPGVRGGTLTDVLAKCIKLSDVRIDWSSADLDGLPLALKEKALTQLHISLQGHSQQQLTQLYRSIKPNVLKRIRLDLFRMTLDVNLLVKELYQGSWAALEEIDFQFKKVNLDTDALFSSLTHLPALRKANFVFHRIKPVGQWLAALTTLFTSHIEMAVSLRCVSTGCRLANCIRQVQSVHPELSVGFGPDGDKLTLTLGKVSFKLGQAHGIIACHNANCVDCARFYPTFIRSLKKRADQRIQGTQQDVHFANGRLDRCRIDSIASDLNKAASNVGFDGFVWVALDAVMNEAQDQATITFGPLVEGIEQFQITVDCGQCLNVGCFGCIIV